MSAGIPRRFSDGKHVGAALSVAALALVVSVPLLAAQEAAPREPDVHELIARAREVYSGIGSMRAHFEQTIEVTLLARTRTGSGRWYQKGPGRFKMDFSDPAGDVIVADGKHLWLYYPSTHPNQVIRSAIEANVTGSGMVDLQGRIFEEAGNYEAELEGREEVRGQSAWRITLIPRTESPYRRVRVWIDPSDYLVRKFEILEENETVRTVTLWDLEPGVAIPDSVFSFVPAAGSDVFEG